jgi:hypothetical protein
MVTGGKKWEKVGYAQAAIKKIKNQNKKPISSFKNYFCLIFLRGAQ